MTLTPKQKAFPWRVLTTAIMPPATGFTWMCRRLPTSDRNQASKAYKATFTFLLVLYLSLPTFYFRGRKNEYSAQRGWRPLANMYYSRNQRIHREKSKARNEAPYAEVWIGKLRQNATRRTALRSVNILTYEEKYSYGASCRAWTDKVLSMLMRDTDVPHFTKTSR